MRNIIVTLQVTSNLQLLYAQQSSWLYCHYLYSRTRVFTVSSDWRDAGLKGMPSQLKQIMIAVLSIDLWLDSRMIVEMWMHFHVTTNMKATCSHRGVIWRDTLVISTRFATCRLSASVYRVVYIDPILYLLRDAMHKRGLCRHAVSVCLSVTFVDSVKTNKYIFNFFHRRVAKPF